MAYLLLAFTLAMWRVIKKRKKLKKFFIITPLIVLGACSFASTGLGAWVAELLSGILAIPAGWAGPAVTPGRIAAVAVLVMLPIAAYDVIHDRKVDKPALICLALLPLMFIIASGPVSGAGRTFTQAISAVASAGFTHLVTD